MEVHQWAVGAVQMKEHLQGVISSLVLIDDIHLHVLKAEGPHVQNRHSDDVHKAIDKVSVIPWHLRSQYAAGHAWLGLLTVSTP